MLNQFQLLLVLTLATASITTTIAKAKVTAGFRRLLRRNAPWFGELFSCAYCLSHWVAFTLVCLYHLDLVRSSWALFDCVVTTFALVTTSALLVGVLSRLVRFEADEPLDERVRRLASELEVTAAELEESTRGSSE